MVSLNVWVRQQARVEGRNGLHTLEYAEQIGLGSQSYQLMDIDNEPEPTEMPKVTMSYENGILTIENLTGEATLIHASYTENQYLNDVEFLTPQTQEVEARNGDKFMLWSGTDKMRPLCDAVVVEETDDDN